VKRKSGVAVIRLQHVGVAVGDFEAARLALERLGLASRDFRNDQGKGFQHDSRFLLGNDCWLHLVHNWNPESRVFRFLERQGPGLEHIALQTDAIEGDVARLRQRGVPLFEDKIFDANDGFEAFVFPNDAIGFTVELIQPHPHSWCYPAEARGRPLGHEVGIVKLHHLGVVVEDVQAAAERFERLFGVPARSAGARGTADIVFGNDCALHLVGPDEPDSTAGRHLRTSGPGIEHLALETRSLPQDVEFLRSRGIRLEERPCSGGEAESVSIPPEAAAGWAIELTSGRR
jgi:methylmalonyl-CoA/ethylmalonyl-CoA epimerase